jgi:hypothetical protein
MDKIIQYSTKDFNFHTIVQEIFSCDNLLYLHKKSFNDDVPDLNLQPGKDQSTDFHKQFYGHINTDSHFLDLYKKFVSKIVSDNVNESGKIFYQKIPTFRVQLPNNKAVGGKSHRDCDYNHPTGEINFLIPLTPMKGTSSVFYESSPGLKDFKFKDLDPGMCWMFNGNQCEHGNMPNITGWTRVSLDFRVISEDKLKQSSGLLSVAHKLKFIEGEYYEAL